MYSGTLCMQIKVLHIISIISDSCGVWVTQLYLIDEPGSDPGGSVWIFNTRQPDTNHSWISSHTSTTTATPINTAGHSISYNQSHSKGRTHSLATVGAQLCALIALFRLAHKYQTWLFFFFFRLLITTPECYELSLAHYCFKTVLWKHTSMDVS